MPQASDELRAKMDSYFDNGGINDYDPFAFLIGHGYSEKRGIIYRPHNEHIPTKKEWDCIEFLCDEWDYGYDPALEKR